MVLSFLRNIQYKDFLFLVCFGLIDPDSDVVPVHSIFQYIPVHFITICFYSTNVGNKYQLKAISKTNLLPVFKIAERLKVDS